MVTQSKNVVSGSHLFGARVFVFGVLLSLFFGVFYSRLGVFTPLLTGLLIIIGIIVGLLNIAHNESKRFLLAALSLVIVSYMGSAVLSTLGSVALIGPLLEDTLMALMLMIVPTAIIVALRMVFEVARD